MLHTIDRLAQRFGYKLTASLYYQLCLDCERGYQLLGHPEPRRKFLTQEAKHIAYSQHLKYGRQLHRLRLPGMKRKVYVIYDPASKTIVTALNPRQYSLWWRVQQMNRPRH